MTVLSSSSSTDFGFDQLANSEEFHKLPDFKRNWKPFFQNDQK